MPTADPVDASPGVQAFRVGTYGHEIQVNGESLSGFDIPPADGWQYWKDVITDVELREGTNTVRVIRDESSDDSFAVNNVTVHWREPVE